jgi:hypothetical protein
MHLIMRRGCGGGASLVFRPRATTPFLEVTLTDNLDTLVVDDRRVEHSVTPIMALEQRGLRDMLLVDFDLAQGSASL